MKSNFQPAYTKETIENQLSITVFSLESSGLLFWISNAVKRSAHSSFHWFSETIEWKEDADVSVQWNP